MERRRKRTWKCEWKPSHHRAELKIQNMQRWNRNNNKWVGFKWWVGVGKANSLKTKVISHLLFFQI